MAPAEALHALQADGTLDRAGTAELIADLDFEASSLRDRVRILEAQIEQDAKTSTDVWRVRAWQSEAILLRYVMTCAAQMRGLQRQARKLKRKDRRVALRRARIERMLARSKLNTPDAPADSPDTVEPPKQPERKVGDSGIAFEELKFGIVEYSVDEYKDNLPKDWYYLTPVIQLAKGLVLQVTAYFGVLFKFRL